MLSIQVNGLALSVKGTLCRTARLRDEGYEFVDDPENFCRAMKASMPGADLFTFAQRIAEPLPKHAYRQEWDELAVLPIQSFDHWWRRQIKDKTRNMVRKAEKMGVVVRPVELDDELVRGIKVIYDESPMRQGKPFKHYGKDLETLHRDHATYRDRSDFLGAYAQGRFVGFVKLVHQPGWSSLMQIISLIAERNKAPTNALIAKAIEVCAQKGVPLLQYGIWSRRGVGDFKEHHGFRLYQVPRYYVPLSLAGRAAIAMGLHRPLSSRLPGTWLDRAAAIRANWNSIRYRGSASAGTGDRAGEQQVRA